MSLSLGRQLYLQPRAALTVVVHLQKCRVECSEQNVVARRKLNFHSCPANRVRRIFPLTEKCSRIFTTEAALNRRGGETSWDRAAEHYFSDGKVVTTSNERAGENERRERVRNNSERSGNFERTGSPEKNKTSSFQNRGKWYDDDEKSVSFERGSNADVEGRRGVESLRSKEDEWASRNRIPSRQERRQDWDADGFSNSGGGSSTGERRGTERTGRDSPSTSSATFRDSSTSSSSRKPISFRERSSTAGRERQWQKSQPRFQARQDEPGSRGGGEYSSRSVESMSKGYDKTARLRGKSSWNNERAADWPHEERFCGEGDEWRWRAREPPSPLEMEGQAVYGVAPIVSALQACRRTFYTLYMQENLAQNLMTGKRKDKQAVSWIQRKAKSLGVVVKEASKHDLNMLVDNRPHQGLVLDASPLELVPIDTLEAPTCDGDRAPVWVALDEITDPQNFGAVLRSAYFLGANGVVVCAKNSAPLSGVVSKASAGALEVMDVQYCRSMIKFLDKSREKGWRVLGGASEASSVPVRDVPRGIATILVLGNEGRGMRTMVKRSCDELVSIVGNSGNIRTKNEYVYDTEDDEEPEAEDDDDTELGMRRGAELDLGSAMAVDSLNVSVAAGILLHELITPISKQAADANSNTIT